jgi:exonuclease VII small subunit
MIRQAALDLERVIQGMVEGGFALEDAEASWQRAMAHTREIATQAAPTSDTSADGA